MLFGEKSVLKTFLLFVSFILSLIIYLPEIISNVGIYKNFGIALSMLFVCLCLITFSIKPFLHIRLINVYFVILIIFFTETLIFSSLGFYIKFTEIQQLVIPFIVILIGYNINISLKSYLIFIFVYCTAALVLSVYSIFHFIGSFRILDEILVSHKNALGPILSNSGVIIMCMIVLKDKSKYRKILLILYGTMIFACLLVLKTRAAFIALLLCFLVVIWVSIKYKIKGIIIFSTLIITVIIIYLYSGMPIPGFLNSFFIGNYDSTSLEGISAGRTNVYIKAFKLISNYPIFGELTTSFHLDTVHNYVLLKVSRYGLLGSLPLLCLYFYLIWTIISSISKIREIRTEYFGYFVMVVPLIVSLFEPSSPYGPGSVQAIAFFMFGYSLKHSSYETSTLINNH